jgi:hypothetical protein
MRAANGPSVPDPVIARSESVTRTFGSGTVHGTALSVTFQPGSGIAPAQFGSPGSSLPASLTVSAAGPAGPLPAAATSAFVAATGQGRGSTFPISIDGTSLRRPS